MQRFNFSSDKNLICVFSERKDGNMDFYYGSKNEVLENRKAFEKFTITSERIYEGSQSHAVRIKLISKKNKKRIFSDTDGLITNLPQVFLMIKTADCFPIVFFDPQRKAVAAVHAGWRGAIQKIFLEVLLLMVNKLNCRPENIKIGIGPGIRQCCFIHNHLIQEKLPEWKDYLAKTKKGISADMPAFIKDKLVLNGIKKNNIKDSKICTVCNNNFYSHFRSLRQGEPEGRLATIIGIRN